VKKISFHRHIRTSNAAPHAMPEFIETVEVAMDQIQELPFGVLDRDHWRTARAALGAVLDHPNDQAKLRQADGALRCALATEGWLNELKLM
jgi:hypothetical protein